MVYVCDDAKVAYVFLFHYCKTTLFEANTKLLWWLKKLIFVDGLNSNVDLSFYALTNTIILIMKRLIYILCTFFTLSIFAQQIETINSKLLFRYDAEFLNNLVLTNPSKLNYLNFYVENSYAFHQSDQMPLEKLDQIPNILNFISVPESFEIPSTIDQTNFNILMFDVVFKQDKQNIYRLGDSNILVYLKSKEEIYTLYNNAN
jgi:hypothetical protein